MDSLAVLAMRGVSTGIGMIYKCENVATRVQTFIFKSSSGQNSPLLRSGSEMGCPGHSSLVENGLMDQRSPRTSAQQRLSL